MAGGDEDKPRSFGDLCALVHSEASEAFEAYREHGLTPWKSHTYSEGFKDGVPDYMEGKPEGVAAELADVVIRVAGHGGALRGGLGGTDS